MKREKLLIIRRKENGTTVGENKMEDLLKETMVQTREESKVENTPNVAEDNRHVVKSNSMNKVKIKGIVVNTDIRRNDNDEIKHVAIVIGVTRNNHKDYFRVILRGETAEKYLKEFKPLYEKVTVEGYIQTYKRMIEIYGKEREGSDWAIECLDIYRTPKVMSTVFGVKDSDVYEPDGCDISIIGIVRDIKTPRPGCVFATIQTTKPNGRASYIPVIMFGKNKERIRDIMSEIRVGDWVCTYGTVQNRELKGKEVNGKPVYKKSIVCVDLAKIDKNNISQN